ncbi:MAG: ribosome biogenesis GTPase Der [Pseudomonadota bacterium]|nr:ribosome biogenesis GTPase Der [Pseudomonadota bacterium]
MPATIAIVGRPNVGKSTLFNRLVGKKSALTDQEPGVTRDRREGIVAFGTSSFRIIDTAGLEAKPQSTLENNMQNQTIAAIASAQLVLLVIDGRSGLTPLDEHFNELVRKNDKSTLVVVNKSEGRAGGSTQLEAFALGLGQPIPVSAQHGDGIFDLLSEMARLLQGKKQDQDIPKDPDAARISIAILGRPNTGKSTLFNTLAGENRVMTGPEPGVTRDAIHFDWTYGEQLFRLIDTAGLRRKARVINRLEQMSTADSMKALRFCNVAFLVLDAVQNLERQDTNIAQNIADQGRAMVIILNKWDLVSQKKERESYFVEQIESSLPQIRGVPIVKCSATAATGIDALMKQTFEAHRQWNRRINTSELNRWLADTAQRHPPPMINKRAVKIRYITQYATRPPRFSLSINKAGGLSDSYIRYLINELRTAFHLRGTPIRMLARARNNPYSQ